MPHARPLSHIRVYRKRARPLREKWQKEYMRRASQSASLQREELDSAKTHLREARACQMAEAMCDVYSCTDRESAAAAPDRLCL